MGEVVALEDEEVELEDEKVVLEDVPALAAGAPGIEEDVVVAVAMVGPGSTEDESRVSRRRGCSG